MMSLKSTNCDWRQSCRIIHSFTILYVFILCEFWNCFLFRYTEPDFLFVRSWLPSVFFSGGVTVGNIGRQLASVSTCITEAILIVCEYKKLAESLFQEQEFQIWSMGGVRISVYIFDASLCSWGSLDFIIYKSMVGRRPTFLNNTFPPFSMYKCVCVCCACVCMLVCLSACMYVFLPQTR